MRPVRYLSALAVAGLFAAASSVASAATIGVNYVVTGSFSIVGAGSMAGNQFALSNADQTVSTGGISLSYSGTTAALVAVANGLPALEVEDDGSATPELKGLLGAFNLQLASGTLADFDLDDIRFTLNIQQTSPTIGSGTLLASVDGQIKYRSTTNTLELVFDGQDAGTGDVTIVVPAGNGISYTTHSPAFSVQSLGQTQTIDGNLAFVNTPAVPLPAAAWSGLGLLGLVGFVQARRLRAMK